MWKLYFYTPPFRTISILSNQNKNYFKIYMSPLNQTKSFTCHPFTSLFPLLLSFPPPTLTFYFFNCSHLCGRLLRLVSVFLLDLFLLAVVAVVLLFDLAIPTAKSSSCSSNSFPSHGRLQDVSGNWKQFLKKALKMVQIRKNLSSTNNFDQWRKNTKYSKKLTSIIGNKDQANQQQTESPNDSQNPRAKATLKSVAYKERLLSYNFYSNRKPPLHKCREEPINHFIRRKHVQIIFFATFVYICNK